MKGFKTADFWSGIVLALLGVYIVAQARQWEYHGADGPGAGFFPLWYGIAMLVLAGTLSISSFLGAERESGALDWNGIRRALTTWLALAIAVALLPVLGFVAGFGLLAFFIVAVPYRRPLKSAALIAACSTAGFYLVFPVALGVELPAGLLGF
jgi:putative tricarboxylic transport membrane protein